MCSGFCLCYEFDNSPFKLDSSLGLTDKIIFSGLSSWWGAWLNQNNDKIVICPKKWYADNRRTDILPDDWVKIDV